MATTKKTTSPKTKPTSKTPRKKSATTTSASSPKKRQNSATKPPAKAKPKGGPKKHPPTKVDSSTDGSKAKEKAPNISLSALERQREVKAEAKMYEQLKNAAWIPLAERRYLFVNPKNGEILGPKAEGTLASIFYVGKRDTLAIKNRLGNAEALRIPRLLQGDDLLNLHIADIVYNEGIQQDRLADESSILRTCSETSRFILKNFTAKLKYNNKITDFTNYFIGFFLAPNSQYRVAIICEDKAWPEEFEHQIKDSLQKGGKTISDLHALLMERHTQINNDIDYPGSENSSGEKIDNLVFIPYNPEVTKTQIEKGEHQETNVGEDTIAESSESASKAQESETISDQDHNSTEAENPRQPPPCNTWRDLNIFPFNRLEMDRIARESKLGGWWFLLPAARYNWQTVNLQRYLVQNVETSLDQRDANNHQTDHGLRLAKWKLEKWVKLVRHLTKGIAYLHSENALHGDMRPANIMAFLGDNLELDHKSFKWIDIALGYSNSHAAVDETKFSPGPLGGRSTIFYAPERGDASEHEDFDQVSFVLDDKVNKLHFISHRRTNIPSTEPAYLSRGKRIFSPIAELKNGDKIQVREFLFEVERVEEQAVIVSRVFHIMLDRVLIEIQRGNGKKTNHMTLDSISKILNRTPISRYRIFQQWSEASDLYSLGILSLYIFYMFGITQYVKLHGMGQGDEDDPVIRRMEHRSDRQKAFANLIEHLSKDEFRERFFNALFDKDIKNESDLLNLLGVDTSIWKKNIDKTAQARARICGSARDLKLIHYAVGQNDLLFTLIIYFCLACTSRSDQLHSIDIQTEQAPNKNSNKFDFKPYCTNRLRIANNPETAETNPAGPATRALRFLERFEKIENRLNDDDAYDSLHDTQDSNQGSDAKTTEAFRESNLTLEEQFDNMVQEHELANNKWQDAKEELEKIKGNAEKLEEQLAAYRNKVEILSNLRTNLRGEIKSANDKLLQIEAEKSAIQKTITRKEANWRDEMEKLHSKYHNEKQALQATVKSLERQYTRNEKALTETSKTVESLEGMLNQCQHKASQLAGLLEDMFNELSSLSAGRGLRFWKGKKILQADMLQRVQAGRVRLEEILGLEETEDHAPSPDS
ncbi:MAG: hypothetical protein HQL53_04080 [Magnetococcales bacterium]|nr:hypothetical protein [Magnetococcales bacterium]